MNVITFNENPNETFIVIYTVLHSLDHLSFTQGDFLTSTLMILFILLTFFLILLWGLWSYYYWITQWSKRFEKYLIWFSKFTFFAPLFWCVFWISVQNTFSQNSNSENFFYDFWTIVNISASWASSLVDVSYSNHFLICFELHRDKSQTRKIIWIFAPKVNIIHEICDHWLDFPQILGKFISPWFLLYHSEMARIFGGLEVGTLEVQVLPGHLVDEKFQSVHLE